MARSRMTRSFGFMVSWTNDGHLTRHYGRR
jgi:hypothetical protein